MADIRSHYLFFECQVQDSIALILLHSSRSRAGSVVINSLHTAGLVPIIRRFAKCFLSADQVASLLQVLGLSQAIFKPIPALVGNLTAPLAAIGDAADGILGSLPIPLPKLSDIPLIGQILEA